MDVFRGWKLVVVCDSISFNCSCCSGHPRELRLVLVKAIVGNSMKISQFLDCKVSHLEYTAEVF